MGRDTASRHPTDTATRAQRLAWWFALLAVLGVLITNAARFLNHQSLWMDEATQLAGIRLGPRAVLHWLLDGTPALGVPPDRMPPGSYWIGMAWASASGGTEAAMRWLGITCVALGTLTTTLAALRAFGHVAALAGALFLALSPNVTTSAVDIRAYPVFFLTASAATYALVRSLEEGASRRRWLVATAAASAAAGYVHFFGVVLGGALFAALLADAWWRRRPFRPVLEATAAWVAALLPLAPFVLSAMRMSAQRPATEVPSTAARAVGLVRLVYRLYGHPALAGSTGAAVLGSLGFLIVIAMAFVAIRRGSAVDFGVVVALAAGMGAVVVASFSVRGMDPAEPHYNIWMLPLVSLLVSSALRATWAYGGRVIAAAGVLGILVGSTLGQRTLAHCPDAYAHTPQRSLAALLRKIGVARVALVHDAESAAPLHIFYPVRIEFADAIPQYRMTPSGPRPVDEAHRVPDLASRDVAVVVRAWHASAEERAAARCLSPPPAASVTAATLERMGWRLASRERFVAGVSADIEVLDRVR